MFDDFEVPEAATSSGFDDFPTASPSASPVAQDKSMFVSYDAPSSSSSSSFKTQLSALADETPVFRCGICSQGGE